MKKIISFLLLPFRLVFSVFALLVMSILLFIGCVYSIIFNKECECKGECPYYDKESFYCQNGGGNYCGEYREIKKVEK